MTIAPAGARREVRRAVDFGCELISPRSDRIHHYRVTNLSSDGMFMHTANPARAGEYVVVCFRPNDGWCAQELTVFGEVVRVTSVRPREGELPPDVGMAIELLDLSEQEKSELLGWLKARRAPVPRRRRPSGRKAPSQAAALPCAPSPAPSVPSASSQAPSVPSAPSQAPSVPSASSQASSVQPAPSQAPSVQLAPSRAKPLVERARQTVCWR